MGIPDSLKHLGLSDLKSRTDDEVVRIWLAERGFVAVDRRLMDAVVRNVGKKLGVVYHADGDYYFQREGQ